MVRESDLTIMTPTESQRLVAAWQKLIKGVYMLLGHNLHWVWIREVLLGKRDFWYLIFFYFCLCL